ncbi:MAG TPA: 23S rRNA (adenine(2030)-N(6))-methyltransferase RlmJ [Micropepsaceae bacterium]|nr:23S rRNA (adenine(2030)-N(6))-methyltransferase RlmJ [Micropepsaceae bacterium]
MNYRHAYHAGNFADCLKHAALVAVLQHLRKKETPFAVIDTHGGRGLYDIGGEEAKKTGEAEAGIVRLLRLESVPGVLEPYRECVRSFGEGIYPGSPLIAAKFLRTKDRLVAIEKHPQEYAALASVLGNQKRARVVEGDYLRELPRLLPPAERRGLVLIDPPYEAEDEFAMATRALIAAHSRFATGIYLFWYPAKERPLVAASAGELLNAGIKSLLKLELDVGAPAGRERLSAAGLLIVNPPFGFAEEMRKIMPFLEAILAQGPGASGTVHSFAEA